MAKAFVPLLLRPALELLRLGGFQFNSRARLAAGPIPLVLSASKCCLDASRPNSASGLTAKYKIIPPFSRNVTPHRKRQLITAAA